MPFPGTGPTPPPYPSYAHAVAAPPPPPAPYPGTYQQTSAADPGCLSRYHGSDFFHPESRIRIKEFKYFNPKKWFLSSRKYDPSCSSRIRILTFSPSRIPDPGSKRHRIPDPQHWFLDDESLVQRVP